MQNATDMLSHANGDQQIALVGLIEADMLRGMPSEVQVGEEPTATRDFLAQMSGCGDILPRVHCDDLDLPQGSTYGEAALALSARLWV